MNDDDGDGGQPNEGAASTTEVGAAARNADDGARVMASWMLLVTIIVEVDSFASYALS